MKTTLTASLVVLGMMAGSASAQDANTTIPAGTVLTVPRTQEMTRAGSIGDRNTCLVEQHARLTVYGFSDEFGYLLRHQTLGKTGGDLCDNDLMIWAQPEYVRGLFNLVKLEQQQQLQQRREEEEYGRIMRSLCFDKDGKPMECD